MSYQQVRPLVVLPTFNELDNLPELCGEILRYLPAAEILVVDDASPDGSGKWAEDEAKKHPHLHCLQRNRKMGLGSAYRAGWSWGLERAYDPIISMDVDWSHHPRYLPALVGLLTENGADLGIGSRYTAGGGIKNWPVARRLLSAFANHLSRLLLGWRVRDATSGFRAYRASTLTAIGPRSITAEGYSFLEESLWRIHCCGLKIAETPIMFEDRRGGKSKINRSEIIKAAVNLLLMRWRRIPTDTNHQD